MINEIKSDAQTRMKKSVESFRHDLTKLRTGRASTALIVHADGRRELLEHSFGPSGARLGEVSLIV